MIEAAQLANLGAGIVVGKVGTATVSREDLLSALDGEWPSDPRNQSQRTSLANSIS
jgi:bifunctional ADP-heptose synthase (sugar kinase/adenylyltransferase)